jgi:hypothetical protein
MSIFVSQRKMNLLKIATPSQWRFKPPPAEAGGFTQHKVADCRLKVGFVLG